MVHRDSDSEIRSFTLTACYFCGQETQIKLVMGKKDIIFRSWWNTDTSIVFKIIQAVGNISVQIDLYYLTESYLESIGATSVQVGEKVGVNRTTGLYTLPAIHSISGHLRGVVNLILCNLDSWRCLPAYLDSCGVNPLTSQRQRCRGSYNRWIQNLIMKARVNKATSQNSWMRVNSWQYLVQHVWCSK